MPEEKLLICVHFQNNLNILNVDYAAFFITDLDDSISWIWGTFTGVIYVMMKGLETFPVLA